MIIRTMQVALLCAAATGITAAQAQTTYDGNGQVPQQFVISGKAAASISARLVAAMGKAGLTPKAILKLPEPRLRECGLSTAKARAIRDLAEKVASGEVLLDDLHERDDEECGAGHGDGH